MIYPDEEYSIVPLVADEKEQVELTANGAYWIRDTATMKDLGVVTAEPSSFFRLMLNVVAFVPVAFGQVKVDATKSLLIKARVLSRRLTPRVTDSDPFVVTIFT